MIYTVQDKKINEGGFIPKYRFATIGTTDRGPLIIERNLLKHVLRPPVYFVACKGIALLCGGINFVESKTSLSNMLILAGKGSIGQCKKQAK